MDKETKAVVEGFERLVEEKFKTMNTKLDDMCIRFGEVEKYASMFKEIAWERKDIKRRLWNYAIKIAIGTAFVSWAFPKVANASEYISLIIKNYV